ncbi:uncharacterized protein BcabD6B2_31040 [Babesia caballi]|uniref:6-Cys domain-containing protein n=1 Tax=Babesia caballi TaxID=5871 RepID=A0AAV4LUG2_BABCB|nr:hypothetical protein, conserved [Babesia caballi]
MVALLSLNVTALVIASAIRTAWSTTPESHLRQADDHTPAQTRLVDGKHQVITVTLYQGQDIKFGCISDDNAGNAATLSLYPSDPRTRTLMPLDESDFESSIRREVLLRDISRSTNLQIGYEKTGSGTGIVKVAYPKNALIMARDPENFSLNFACKYEPKDKSLEPIYRWVKVTFKHVYPLAYGCESGNSMLFKNSVPKMPWLPQQVAHPCEIKPEPGMIFGIYCQPGEQLVPENCILPDALDNLFGVVRPYRLPYEEEADYPDYTVSSRLKLFEVSAGHIRRRFSFSCACVKDGHVTTELKASHLDEMMDAMQYMSAKGISSNRNYQELRLLVPGLYYSINLPFDDWHTVGELGLVRTKFAPKEPLIKVFNAPPFGHNKASKITDWIGSKGFVVYEGYDDTTFTISLGYKKDAVVVLKKPLAFMYYDWILRRSKAYKTTVKSNLRIQYNIIPTDPYTYGCGVDSVDLFRSDHIKLDVLDDEVTVCTVNPYVTSPVGFYCPKGYEMEPANCFTHMIHNDVGMIEPLSTYAPHARAIDSKHIHVVDFTAPEGLKHLVKYSYDRFSCACRDKQGRVRAVITLDLRSPNDDDVKATYQVDETHQ